MRLYDLMKTAEVSGTPLAPAAPIAASVNPLARKTVISKTASMGHLVHQDTHPQNELPAGALQKNENLPAKGINKLPQATPPSPHVVLKPDADKVFEKKATITALPGRYPLDDYGEVKMASAYFDKYYEQFSPEERRTYALNMVKRAEEMAIEVSPVAAKYAGQEHCSPDEHQLAMDLRKIALQHTQPGADALLDALSEKRASLSPDFFCSVLAEFDAMTGINRLYGQGIPDPFYSTYGVKQASEAGSDLMGVGNELVPFEDMKALAIRARPRLVEVFGEDFANEFRKDPRAIYNSMPLNEKKILVRMAAQVASGAQNG